MTATDPFRPASPMASLVGSWAGISRVGRYLTFRRQRTHVPTTHTSRAKASARSTPAIALANTVRVSCPAPAALTAAATLLAASGGLAGGDTGGAGGGFGSGGAGGCLGGEGGDGGAGGSDGGAGGGGDDGCQHWMMSPCIRQPAPGCHMQGE